MRSTERWPAKGRAWLLAGLVAFAAVAWAGWSPWLALYLRLLLGYACADLLLSAFVRRYPAAEIRVALVAAAVAATAGAAATTWLFQQIGTAAMLAATDRTFEFGLGAAFSGIVLATSILERDARSRAERERQLAELRLHALQAQIEPHFLYNTLANVQQLVRSSPSEADRMLDSLIRYLRATIPEIRTGRATVGQELNRAQAYLAIMHMRMGARLRYDIDVPHELHALAVPPLSVMTLVENAVKHGIDAKPEGGRVRIVGARRRDLLELRIIDDGAGFGSDVGSGTGLANLRDRIATQYGERASLELEHAEPCGVEAVLMVPCG